MEMEMRKDVGMFSKLGFLCLSRSIQSAAELFSHLDSAHKKYEEN